MRYNAAVAEQVKNLYVTTQLFTLFSYTESVFVLSIGTEEQRGKGIRKQIDKRTRGQELWYSSTHIYVVGFELNLVYIYEIAL